MQGEAISLDNEKQATFKISGPGGAIANNNEMQCRFSPAPAAADRQSP